MAIPDSVKDIQRSVFSGCWRLERLTLPFIGESEEKNTYLGYLFGASSYYENETDVPASLKEVTITRGGIDDYAFFLCSDLKQFNIKNGVTRIGRLAFHKCTGLKDIYIPESVEEIGLKYSQDVRI